LNQNSTGLGIPPDSVRAEYALANEAAKFTVGTVQNPLVHVNIEVSFAFVRHAMMKIAYELAFRWLGEPYLDDPLAAVLREAICKDDPASTDGLAGYVGTAEPCTAFNFWTPHKAHHLAFASVVAGSVMVAARIFDIYAVAIPVSGDATRYIRTADDTSKLRFLAIDAVGGETIETSFADEQHRLSAAMTKHRRVPPFPDPLSDVEGVTPDGPH
jgi:hypothetical protein